jgi:diadenosine tetraphosphate (Ap4A) HIT family hydrolase
VLWQDDNWLVRHSRAPYGVAGWMMLYARQHVAGPAHFDDALAASFGPTLRLLENALEQVTGALRIYTAAMSESAPHFHAHMVPRYASMPGDAAVWGVFDLARRAAAAEISVNEAEVDRICADYSSVLAGTAGDSIAGSGHPRGRS